MKIKHIIAAGLLATAASFTATSAIAEEAKPPAKEAKPAEKREAVKPYKLDTCIVSDEKLDSMGKPIVKVYDGQEVKFCCEKCIPKFEKDKATYLKKLDSK